MSMILLSMIGWFAVSGMVAVAVGSCIGYGNGAQIRRSRAPSPDRSE